jgi:hypothetical protein
MRPNEFLNQVSTLYAEGGSLYVRIPPGRQGIVEKILENLQYRIENELYIWFAVKYLHVNDLATKPFFENFAIEEVSINGVFVIEGFEAADDSCKMFIKSIQSVIPDEWRVWVFGTDEGKGFDKVLAVSHR